MSITLFLLCIVVLFSLASEVIADRDYVDSMCYAAMWNSGANARVKRIFPLKWKSDGKFFTAKQYYKYGKPHGASANTPDGLEESQVAQYFFYDDDNEVSLFFFFDKPHDKSGGNVKAKITSEGLAGKDVGVTVRDDSGDSSYSWNNEDGTSNPNWRWWECCTDGMVLGNLPQPVEGNDNFNPSDHSYCINIQFLEYGGVNQFKVRTNNGYWEDSGTNHKGHEFFIPADQANTLKLCYTQCNCLQNAVLDSNRGIFDNKAVIEGAGTDSGIGRYGAGSDCSWIIQPELNPNKVALYFREFQFGSEADYVTFASDRQGNDIVRNFVQDDASQLLDWNAKIRDEQTDVGLSGYNNFVIEKSGAKFESLVSFHSDDESPGGTGFVVVYVSVAEVSTATPDQVNIGGNVVVSVGGNFFINDEDLTCKITNQGVDIYVPATYVSDTEVHCTVPARSSFGPVAEPAGTISVPNDAIHYENTVDFNFFDATCGDLHNCKSCTANENCGWCVDVDNYENSKCFSVGDPIDTAPTECTTLATTISWHVGCCDICPGTNDCNGEQGTCECDQTCTCFEDESTIYTGDSCDCECPKGENGEICSGHGSCNCDGTCTCNYPYRGDLCECLECPGSGGEQGFCFGNGECSCDGTCTCDPNFDINFDCLCPLSCPTGPNGEQCSGHGDCSCGECYCDIGFDGQSCECAEPLSCPSNNPQLECSGKGLCGCDQVCTCNTGWTGEDCDTPAPCLQTSCETCQLDFENDGTTTSQAFCRWCPITGQCVNIHSPEPCYATADEIVIAATESDEVDGLLQNSTECPVEQTPIVDEIRAPDNTVPIATGVAAAVGLLLAIILGAVLAILGKNQEEGLTSFDFGNDKMSSATQNPLFSDNTKLGSSGIYQPRVGGN